MVNAEVPNLPDHGSRSAIHYRYTLQRSIDAHIVQLPVGTVPNDADRPNDFEARIAYLEAIVAQHEKTLAIQFERIAQLQAEVDVMRAKSENPGEFVAEVRTRIES